MRSGDNKKDEIRQIKSPDSISVELLETLEDNGIDKITKLLNEIYDIGQIPTDISKSIFLHCQRNQGQQIKTRFRNKMKPEIAGEQFGFVEGKGTTNENLHPWNYNN